nr:hypothetical protein [Xanthomonas arboricola]MDN0298764.1 hypothetical protein [Xanthomonas arboricola pv. pruni]
MDQKADATWRHLLTRQLTQAPAETTIAAAHHRAIVTERLHRCCITFRWALARSKHRRPFTTPCSGRSAICGCGPIWSRARSIRRSATAGPGGEDSLALKQRQVTQCAPGAGFHLAFAAANAGAVNAFHLAALQHGGSCNGAPGLRPDYGDDYYAAFVIDPDGHHIEAVVDTTL